MPVNVTVLNDGPLKISGHGQVRFCGQALETDQEIYICRCGKSTKAPFCDGQHAKTGFSGACKPSKQKEVTVWEGKTLRTFFNPNACMHVYLCKPIAALRERELAGDEQAAEQIVAVVATCPSGALTVQNLQGQDLGSSAQAIDIDIMEGGELRIQSGFEINAERPERQPNTRATLCRCGASKSKPWCDGRHKSLKDFR